ncbi:hypothetical protein GWA01_02790 [Gluconobacter wancherniae NBRC 103581]|uniref:Uncharacterized protein n=1 Tax=Gluconobacter wancherniae NBRC 103581 TaxID=656744 RepID=A0A511AWC1_9PROT|nr:hypothetical protein AA103581_1176 [Gluconobacter wancherniae NBRC 103581]GEK92509.1 hypothetical protein GWA01_02790 [Gluconobacter wancherniae NBRC 103581]
MRDQLAADAEILEGALGLCAPKDIIRDFDLSQTIGFDAAHDMFGLSCRGNMQTPGPAVLTRVGGPQRLRSVHGKGSLPEGQGASAGLFGVQPAVSAETVM